MTVRFSQYWHTCGVYDEAGNQVRLYNVTELLDNDGNVVQRAESSRKELNRPCCHCLDGDNARQASA